MGEGRSFVEIVVVPQFVHTIDKKQLARNVVDPLYVFIADKSFNVEIVGGQLYANMVNPNLIVRNAEAQLFVSTTKTSIHVPSAKKKTPDMPLDRRSQLRILSRRSCQRLKQPVLQMPWPIMAHL